MTSRNMVRVFSPATVANVACAFDVLGFALTGLGDCIIARKVPEKGVRIVKITSPYGTLPIDPLKNTASVSVAALLEEIQPDFGIELSIEKKMPIGSGLGSSAASGAGGVFAANQLMPHPLPTKDLIRFAMLGEKAASGAAHADNVSPALLGGVTLVRESAPLDVIKIAFPESLRVTIVCPLIEVKTEDARKVLRKMIPLKLAVEQFGNIAGLVAGLCMNDVSLIGRSLKDVIIEPERSILIPGFAAVKRAAIDAGALGCSISGSGPAMFSFCCDDETAECVRNSMNEQFDKLSIETVSFISPISSLGAVIEEEG